MHEVLPEVFGATIGVAAVFLGIVIRFLNQKIDKIDKRKIDREVFTAEMRSLRNEVTALREDFRAVRDQVREDVRLILERVDKILRS